MKNNSIIKKVISCFMTFIMVFGIFYIINPKQIQAATYPLKVHYLDVKGDATLIEFTQSGYTYYGMIDVGQETDANQSAAAYFSGIADKANKPKTLDFCIITHAHDDHYMGLQYFKQYKIHIKTLYLNSYYDLGLKSMAISMRNEGIIDNIIQIGYRQSYRVPNLGNLSLTILGPVLPISNNTTDPAPGVVNVRSMMCTLDYYNYKYIFMGDVYEKDGKGLPTITDNKLYQNYLVPKSNQNVIYKISHHGRRKKDNYNEQAELDMYEYISNKGTNKVYCIANKYFNPDSDYYTYSTALQNLWLNKTEKIYFNTGYKKGAGFFPVPRDVVNGIAALTSTTSLYFYS